MAHMGSDSDSPRERFSNKKRKSDCIMGACLGFEASGCAGLMVFSFFAGSFFHDSGPRVRCEAWGLRFFVRVLK